MNLVSRNLNWWYRCIFASTCSDRLFTAALRWEDNTTKIETSARSNLLLKKPSRLFTASPFIFHRVERFICSEATNEKKRTGDLNNTKLQSSESSVLSDVMFLWLGHFSPNLLLVWRCIVFCGQSQTRWPGERWWVHAGLHTVVWMPKCHNVDYYGKIEVHGLRWYTNNLISLPKPRQLTQCQLHSNAQLREANAKQNACFLSALWMISLKISGTSKHIFMNHW